MEVALDKLRGARDKLPPEQHSSDMLNLLEALEGLETAEAELQAAKEEGLPATDPRIFKALVGLLRSYALCGSTARTLFGSAKLAALLNNDFLQPVMIPQRDGNGRLQHVVVCPTEGIPALRPDSAIKLLVAAVEVGRGSCSTGPLAEQAMRVFEMPFLALWMDAQQPMPDNAAAMDVHRQLQSQRWVPAWPAPGSGGGGVQQQWPLTPPARALAAELAAHTPGVTLDDVRQWALLLRTLLCCNGAAPPAPAVQQAILSDCQQLISGGSHAVGKVSPSYAALRAHDVIIGSDSWAGIDDARVDSAAAFVAASIERALEARCWPVASELIHRKLQYNVLPALQPGSRFNRRARQRAREYARELLDQERQCMRASRSWFPARFQQHIKERVQEMEGKLAATEGGGSAAAPKPPSDLPRCHGCGTPNALHLRKCAQCRVAAYCSRACQVKHWREGHKGECAAMAAGRAPEAAG